LIRFSILFRFRNFKKQQKWEMQKRNSKKEKAKKTSEREMGRAHDQPGRDVPKEKTCGNSVIGRAH
jgi:hypothetical protein